MYSAASARFMIHSPSGGVCTPNAMLCAYTAQVAWLSPQMPQMRLVMPLTRRVIAPDGPGVGGDQRGQDAHDRRLSRAVRAGQGEDRAFGDREVDPVERDLVAEGL